MHLSYPDSTSQGNFYTEIPSRGNFYTEIPNQKVPHGYLHWNQHPGCSCPPPMLSLGQQVFHILWKGSKVWQEFLTWVGEREFYHVLPGIINLNLKFNERVLK